MTIPTATAPRIAGRPSFRRRVVVIGGILALVVTVKPWDWLAPAEAILVGTWYELPDDRPGVRWMELWPDRTIVAVGLRRRFLYFTGCRTYQWVAVTQKTE